MTDGLRTAWRGWLGLGLVAVLTACGGTTSRPLSVADLDVVAEDEFFHVVRLRPGQEPADLARLFLGSDHDLWQLEELNPGMRGTAGELLAIPSQPLNVTGVSPAGFRTLPILCYHQFTTDDSPGQKLELRASDFEAQLQYLRDENYALLSFAEVAEILRQKKPIPEKAVVLTIDDGYASVYDVAWPLLKKYGAKATLFIYTDFIGAGAALTWDELRDMRASGLIEVESHGKSHASLSQLPGDATEKAYKNRLAAELSASEASFMANLGSAPDYLSYPYGNSSRVIASVLKESGYSLAATVTRGRNSSFVDPFLLHRTMIYGDHTMQDFKRFLNNFSSRSLPR